MKVKISLNLEEEEYEYKLMLAARDMYIFINDVKQDLRSMWKHGDVDSDFSKPSDLLDHIYENFCQQLGDVPLEI